MPRRRSIPRAEKYRVSPANRTTARIEAKLMVRGKRILNLNFTNVCFVNCQFCAFKRQRWEADAYTHGLDRILEKIDEAIERGATEVCMQGGINPDMHPFYYRDLLLDIKSRFPALHVHAFSPMEILYGSRRTGLDSRTYVAMLRDCGLGSIPGTAAEILDDDVRQLLSHKKVDVRA